MDRWICTRLTTPEPATSVTILLLDLELEFEISPWTLLNSHSAPKPAAQTL